jgi:5'-nucleotidase
MNLPKNKLKFYLSNFRNKLRKLSHFSLQPELTAIPNKLVVAISSRALFNLDESHEIFEHHGIEKYARYQIQHENEPLQEGVAFSLVKKLLALNSQHEGGPFVEVILLSRNSADTGLRVFNSIAHYNLGIKCAAFTGGQNPYRYVSAFHSHLFLSANSQDVCSAIQAGCAAATIINSKNLHNDSKELRIAFDGDAVLFSDDSQKIYDNEGLEAFENNEKQAAMHPLPGGPFRAFLASLNQLQKKFPPESCPIRTALVTARSAPAHERVIRTLRAWDIRIDEALFLMGRNKTEFLTAFGADFFFDDQMANCIAASNQIPTGHVPQ